MYFVTCCFSLSGASHENYQALWFDRCEDRITGEQVHIYKGGYWEAKDRGKWEGCPDIFWPRIDFKVPWKDWSINGPLPKKEGLPPPPPFSLHGCLPPVTLCSKRSPGWSLLSSPDQEQVFSCYFGPLFLESACCCHTSEEAAMRRFVLLWQGSSWAQWDQNELDSASKSTEDHSLSLSVQVCSDLERKRFFTNNAPVRIMSSTCCHPQQCMLWY